MRKFLIYSNVWHIDGTFMACPTCPYHVYANHTSVNTQTVPIAFFSFQTRANRRIIMPSSICALIHLNEIYPGLEPLHIVVGFEKASKCLQCFCGCTNRRCYFCFSLGPAGAKFLAWLLEQIKIEYFAEFFLSPLRSYRKYMYII